MNVLSLFDGMSCGQIALNRVGIEYDNYYASEIESSIIIINNSVQICISHNIYLDSAPAVI